MIVISRLGNAGARVLPRYLHGLMLLAVLQTPSRIAPGIEAGPRTPFNFLISDKRILAQPSGTTYWHNLAALSLMGY